MGAAFAPGTQLARPSAETRHAVREALTAAAPFARIDSPTQQELAHSLVRIAEAARLLEHDAGRQPPAPASRAMNAGDEFSGTAVERVAGTTRNILQAISFPRFVAELINGVFKAIVDTNQQQLQQYLELIRGVSQSLEGFSSLGGNDDAARRWLVERFPGSFAIEGEGEEPDDFPTMGGEEEREPLRLISVGSPPSPEALRAALSLEADAEVPSGGGEALVPFVRRALARNRQGMLATMIQMGMQRIVIDSGKITAGMRFHIDATSAAQDRQTSAFDTRTSLAASGSVGFGWWSASASMSTTIGYVRTSDTTTSEDLTASADLNSSVELNFRTDQVPLDRLASQATQERLTQNSLNPSRETELMLQAEQARQQRYQARDTARESRAAPTLAPSQPPLTAPTAPQLDSNIIAERARAASGNAGSTSTSPPPGGSTTTAPVPPPPGGSSTTAPAPPPPSGSSTTAPAPPPPGGSSTTAPAPPPPGGSTTTASTPPPAGGSTTTAPAPPPPGGPTAAPAPPPPGGSTTTTAPAPAPPPVTR